MRKARCTGTDGCPLHPSVSVGGVDTHQTLSELQATFDLRWDADMRAIKRWQAAHPDRPNVELTWPDHADMVVWLLEKVDQQEASLKAIVQRHYVALHGLVGADVASLGFEEVTTA